VDVLVEAPHDRFRVLGDGRILAGEQAVGRLVRGADRLHPEVTVLPPLGAGARLRLGRRLLAYARDLVAELLAALPPPSPEAGPAARGLLYQLEQSLGSVTAQDAREQLRALGAGERRWLSAHVVLGRLAVFVPALLSAGALEKRRALCAAELWPDQIPPSPGRQHGELRLPVDAAISPRIYQALGYPILGGLAVRADALERSAHAPPPRSSLLARTLGTSLPEATTFLAAVRDQVGGRRRRR
jgi:ATP-dependent RNA helicase SUPV3L1/SUV3